MNNAMNIDVPALDTDEFDAETNPAGEMALSSMTKVGLRTRVLGGFALTAGLAVVAFGATTLTTVSAPGNPA
ncbi:hypothetical protein [Umezawaea sp. NPDC059074]|uniref:hypothetical protein n=1 Tax=Umezawaea sp. NPDC059074 TaxID=3346716 RepID=UPI0036BDB5C3